MSEVSNAPGEAAPAVDNQDLSQQGADENLDSGLEGDLSSEDGSANPDDAIDAAAKAGEITKQEAKELKKILKLKVDGQEFEEEVDFNDEEGLKKHLQKSKAFDKRLKEFSQYKSQVDSIIEQLKQDPESILEKLGLDVDQLAEKRLSRKVEEMKKSPEQIEREKMQKELEDLRKEKKSAEESREKSELERMRNEQAQKIEVDITDALDSAKSILPKKNPLVMQRVAQTMLMAMQNGYENVTAKDVIPLVEKQWRSELNEFFNVLPEETIEMLVGKENLSRYRKKQVSSNRPKVQTATAKQVAKDTGTRQEVEEDDRPKKKMRDFFRE
jgi:hypothetical protein